MNSTARAADISPYASSSTTADPRFSCNICFDDVSDPVVTQCGHLYCWGCLFRWIEPGLTTVERQTLNLQPVLLPMDQSHRVCPVCKSPCSVTSVIPIYIRNADPVDYEDDRPSGHRQATAEEDHAVSSSLSTHPEHSSNTNSPESFDSTVVTGPDETSSPFGLRQRLRFRSSDSNSQPAGTSSEVTAEEEVLLPARPTARRRSLSENAVGQFQQQQQQLVTAESMNIINNNNNRTLMISQGLAMGLHRALRPAATASPTIPTSTAVPPLHRQEGHGSHAHYPFGRSASVLEESDPDATEFLSRILLMLGSFVVLCLLLF